MGDSENIDTDQLIRNINKSLGDFTRSIKEGNKAFINVSAQINKIAAKFVYDSKLSDQISKQKSAENRIRQRERVYLERYHSEQVRRNKQFGKSIMNMNEKFNFVTQSLTKGRGIGTTIGILGKNVFNSSKSFYRLEKAQEEYAEALLNPSDKVTIDTKKEALTGAEEGVGGMNKQLAFLSKKLAKAGTFFSKHSTGIILGAGVAGVLVGVIIKAMSIAPMFQAMLKLMKFAVMMILMPIGTFFGAIIKPFMVGFIKVLAPEFKKWMVTSMKIGDMIGKALYGFKLDSISNILSAMMPLIPIIPMILSALKPTIDGLTKLNWESIVGGVMVVVDVFTKLGSQIGIPSVIKAFGEVVTSFGGIFSDPELVTKIQTSINSFMGTITTVFGDSEFVKNIGATVISFFDTITTVFGDSVFIKNVGTTVIAFLDDVKIIFADSEFIKGVGTTIISFLDDIKIIFADTELITKIGSNILLFMSSVKTVFSDTELITKIGTSIDTFLSTIERIFAIGDSIIALPITITNFISEIGKLFLTTIPEALQGFSEKFSNFWSGIFDTIIASFIGIPIIGDWIKDYLNETKENMSEAPKDAKIVENYLDKTAIIAETFPSYAGDVEKVFENISKSLDIIPAYAKSVVADLRQTSRRFRIAPEQALDSATLLIGVTQIFDSTFEWIKRALRRVSRQTYITGSGSKRPTAAAIAARATLGDIGGASINSSVTTDTVANWHRVVTGADILEKNKFAKGGIIDEPILGIGASGQQYLMGENGREFVTPANQISNNKSININIHIDKIEKDADFNRLKPMIQRWILEANSRRGMI